MSSASFKAAAVYSAAGSGSGGVEVGHGHGDGGDGAGTGAGVEDRRDAEIAERHHRRLADADLLAVHEAEEGQHRAGEREGRRLHELAVDDEDGDRARG